jgi:glycosyltransferase involved in cell wall biosynthesis
MTPPLVSILVPARNAAAWIGSCLASARDQVHPHIEVIVWDDGSSDATRAVAGKIAGVQVLGGPPAGGNVARNRLLAAARGDWIQYLDADDYLEPTKIASQLAAVRTLEAIDVLYSPTWIETWRAGRAVHREPSRIDATADLFTQWLAWELPQTGGALWRRSGLVALGGWNEAQPCCQEHELYLRALQAGARFQFCPEPGAVYRIWSEETICRRDPVLLVREKAKLIDRMLAWLSAEGQLLPAHRAAAGQAYFEMARTWARHDLAAATAYYRERKAQGVFRLTGPAAPAGYRLMLAALGFPLTEKILRARRRARAAPGRSGTA